MSKKRFSKPDWLTDYRRRTRLIEVIDMAFDNNVSDKEVRTALVEAAEELGELFMPPAPPSERRRR